MKKALLFLSALWIITDNMGIAQTMKEEKVVTFYTKLPMEPLPKNIKTYHIVCDASENSASKPEIITYMYEQLELPGYQKVENQFDLLIECNLEPFNFQEEIIKYKEERKVGSEKIEVEKWKCMYRYQQALFMKISDVRNGHTLFEGYTVNTDKHSNGETEGFNTQADAENYWSKNADALKIQLAKQVREQNIFKTGRTLKSTYGLHRLRKTLSIYYPSSKKEDYSDLESIAQKAKVAYEYYKYEGDDPQAEASLRAVIADWEKALADSDLSSKKAKINTKVTLMLLRNCLIAYYWLNDFEKSRAYLEKAQSIQKGVRWYYTEKVFLDDREERFLANQ